MAGKFKPALVLLDKNRIVTLIKYSTFVLVAIVLATAVMRFSWESFEGLFSLEFVMSLGGILLGLNVFTPTRRQDRPTPSPSAMRSCRAAR